MLHLHSIAYPLVVTICVGLFHSLSPSKYSCKTAVLGLRGADVWSPYDLYAIGNNKSTQWKNELEKVGLIVGGNIRAWSDVNVCTNAPCSPHLSLFQRLRKLSSSKCTLVLEEGIEFSSVFVENHRKIMKQISRAFRNNKELDMLLMGEEDERGTLGNNSKASFVEKSNTKIGKLVAYIATPEARASLSEPYKLQIYDAVHRRMQSPLVRVHRLLQPIGTTTNTYAKNNWLFCLLCDKVFQKI